MEAARKSKSPVIIQVSNGGGAFIAGKGLKTEDAAAIGSVALAMHVRSVAKYYGIPVVLHSDHCAKNLLPWFDGMLKADEILAKYGEPLSPPTCLIFPRSLMKRTLLSAWSISSEWPP
jgi:fructose-bisphosphate aldolase class II